MARTGVQKFRKALNIFNNIYNEIPIQQILIFLELAEHGDMPQNELGDRLKMTPASLSRNLKRLQNILPRPEPKGPNVIDLKKYGLVSKRYDEANPRSLTVFLTKEGQEICDKIEAACKD